MHKKLLAVALVAGLVAPATALAKGPSEAKITGKGIKGAIVLKSDTGGDPSSGTPLGNLTEGAGFFPAMFGQDPDPMLAKRPTGDLGPKYTVEYTVPGPNNEVDRIHQDLYPYAAGGPVTYTPRGQEFFGDQSSRGGWFQASITLDELHELGLPATRPSDSGSGLSFSSTSVWGSILAVSAFALLAGAAAYVLIRRRPRAVPAR